MKVDVSGTFKTFDESPFFRTRHSLYNVTAGIQVKNNKHTGRFKPFAHVLIGAAHVRSSTSNFTCSPAANCAVLIPPSSDANTDTRFAGAFGGGLDIKINDRFDIRAIQVDYNPVFVSGGSANNVRIAYTELSK